MSWAEIKKSVNSDLSTPLDEILKNTTYGLSAIKDAINAVSTGGTIKIVKSVQRGIYSSNGDVNISSVNVSKSIILLNGWLQTPQSNTAGGGLRLPHVSRFSGTSFTVQPSGNTNAGLIDATFSWQVIEFY